jgi:hypothetical protein
LISGAETSVPNAKSVFVVTVSLSRAAAPPVK